MLIRKEDLPRNCQTCKYRKIGYHGPHFVPAWSCYCLPYWGREITNWAKWDCPLKTKKNAGTLKSMCHVNKV